MQYHAGLLHLQAGRVDPACQCLARSLNLTTRHLLDVLRISDELLSEEQIVNRILPPAPALLVNLAEVRYSEPQYEKMRALLTRRAAAVLDTVELPQDQKTFLQAAIYALQDRNEEAIEAYVEAIDLRPPELDWRFRLAKLLLKENRLREAHEHARFCARLNGEKQEYRDLLEQVNRALVRGSTLKPDFGRQ